MIRSMFSAISGLRNHQTMMDVVGNNIANVNTVGFKSSAVVFEDVLSQNVRGSTASTATTGGTNANAIGLGSKVASITTNLAEGSLQRTGRSTDFAIQGEGFFAVDQGGERLYTRGGSLATDALGRLTTSEGGFVQGWQADQFGNVLTTGPTGKVSIPVGDMIAAVRTTQVNAGGNLPADVLVGATYTNAVDVYDGQGSTTTLHLEYTKTAADSWKVEARYVTAANTLVPAPPAVGQAITGSPMTFDASGELTSSYNMTLPAGFLPNFPTQALTINVGAAGLGGRMTQFGGINSVAIHSQDGAGAGTLQGFNVGQDGLITGTYTNGRSKPVGQIAVASFSNPEGLEQAGGTSFHETVNSGIAQLGVAGQGRGLMAEGTLESSNVDLSTEFTNLIIAQRGFQANSRVITTSDEMLQELVNLKR